MLKKKMLLALEAEENKEVLKNQQLVEISYSLI